MPNANDFNYALLGALQAMGGECDTPQLIYPRVEKELGINRQSHPELYEMDEYGDLKWHNKTRFARQYLKEIGALDCPSRGRWILTAMGSDLLNRARELLNRLDENSMAAQEYIELRNIILLRIIR